MKDLHKAAMIVGLVAMMGLGLLLCFAPAKNNKWVNNMHQYVSQKEP